MNRFRPRFSLRTLAIIVTLICAYFGALEATKKWGCSQLDEIGYTSASIPFVVSVAESETDRHGYYYSSGRHLFYLWFFGLTIKLPIEGPSTGMAIE